MLLFLSGCASSVMSSNIPGTTLVNKDPVLARDTYMFAMRSASIKLKQPCEKSGFKVLDTIVLMPPKQHGNQFEWSESWTVNICTETVKLHINFATGPNGTNFSMPMNNK